MRQPAEVDSLDAIAARAQRADAHLQAWRRTAAERRKIWRAKQRVAREQQRGRRQQLKTRAGLGAVALLAGLALAWGLGVGSGAAPPPVVAVVAESGRVWSEGDLWFAQVDVETPGSAWMQWRRGEVSLGDMPCDPLEGEVHRCSAERSLGWIAATAPGVTGPWSVMVCTPEGCAPTSLVLPP